MTWTPVHVEITAGDGSIIGARDNGREAFDRGFDGKWDPLNLAYFNGYAMWTYHATPFVFGEPGYEARDVAPIENAGETLRGVAVRFPEGVHPRVLSVIFLKGAASASCATCRARAAPGRRAR
jgi:hypothetical protein